MNGIYLTEQGKEEIEAKIAELENETHGSDAYNLYKSGVLSVFTLILKSATILPVEESWEQSIFELPFYIKQQLENNFPNGVIIQPKQ